jgi:hypothetical protein
MKDRNTTVLGVAGIIIAIANAAICYADGNPETAIDFGSLATAVALGIGLIRAADSKNA